MNNQNNQNNQQTATQKLRAELAKAKAELAKEAHSSKLLKATLKEYTTKANALTKDKLDEVYDPADPASVQKAIDAHNQQLQESLDNIFSDIENKANDYVEKNFKKENLELEDRLAVFNEANKTNLTAEQLEDELPPKITKQYKDNEEGLFKAATDYLKQVQTPQTPQIHNATPPHTPAGNQTPAPDQQSNEGGEGEQDEMY